MANVWVEPPQSADRGVGFKAHGMEAVRQAFLDAYQATRASPDDADALAGR